VPSGDAACVTLQPEAAACPRTASHCRTVKLGSEHEGDSTVVLNSIACPLHVTMSVHTKELLQLELYYLSDMFSCSLSRQACFRVVCVERLLDWTYLNVAISVIVHLLKHALVSHSIGRLHGWKAALWLGLLSWHAALHPSSNHSINHVSCP